MSYKKTISITVSSDVLDFLETKLNKSAYINNMLIVQMTKDKELKERVQRVEDLSNKMKELNYYGDY